LTTTQRMKEFRTAHSESVVKEQERNTSRPSQKNFIKPSTCGRHGLPGRSLKETAFLSPPSLPCDRINPDASELRRGSLHLSGEGWWR